METVERLPFTERNMMEVIVKRIYGQTSIRLTDEQLDKVVDSALADENWVQLTENIANDIYAYEKK